MNLVYLFLVFAALSVKTVSSKSSGIMDAFEDCHETLIENGRIIIFSDKQKFGKVICDEGFQQTDGSGDFPCVGGKWMINVACLSTSEKNYAPRKKREVDDSATTGTPTEIEDNFSSRNEGDEMQPSMNIPTTPTPSPLPTTLLTNTTAAATTRKIPATTTILRVWMTTLDIYSISKVHDDCTEECVNNGNLILILSPCLVGLIFLVIILVICIVRDRRRRTGERVGRIQGAKKEVKKSENVVLVDVAQVDGKQENAPHATEVTAIESLPNTNGSSPKELPTPSNIKGNPASVDDKQQTLPQVAEARAKPTKPPPSINVIPDVQTIKTEASTVEPSVVKTAELETPAELEKEAPPDAHQVEVPLVPEVDETLDSQPDVQLGESVLQEVLKEAFGEGNN